MLPLASPTSSQRLKEARYRQDNNRLIRGYIESRLELKRYKPETHVHTHSHTHMGRLKDAVTHWAGVIMVHDDTLKKKHIADIPYIDKHV